MATKTKKPASRAAKPVGKAKNASKKSSKSVKTATKKKAAPAKPAKKAPVKAKAAPKKATTKTSKPAAKAPAPSKKNGKVEKPVAKAVKSIVKAVKNVVKAVTHTDDKPKTKSSLVAKPVGTKARPQISHNKGKSYGKRKNGADNVRPERAAEIPVRTVKVQQPEVKITPQDPNKTRYSDAELAEFKTLIDEKLEAAKNELRYLQDQINRKDDNGTDDTENKFSNLEDGSVTMEREYLNQMAVRQAQYIDHLEKALMRIRNKTYGICRVTGKLIDKDRLRAVPHATLSMEAKLMQNR